MSETVAVRMSVRQDDRVECFVMGLSEAGDYTFRERFADIGEAATFAVKKALEHKVELRVYEVRGKK